jgi:hypothetical protein
MQSQLLIGDLCMLKHFASLVLLIVLAVLAVGSSDSGSGTPSSSERTNSTGSQAVTAGEAKQISGEHRFGCSDREYFEKLISYAVQNDNKAFSQGLAAGLLSGTCTAFDSGQSVYITDTAIFSGLVEVRKAGSMQEYWTNLEAVK